jgi:hypothetical protein
MLNNGIQEFIRTIGDEGCYALCLCKAAEIFGNKIMGVFGGNSYAWCAAEAVGRIEKGVECGYIKNDMTVLDGAAFLRQLTGTVKRWTKEYKPAGYKPAEGDYLIAEWFNRRTGKTHFTLEYPEKWNSLRDSVTVKEGSIRSYRLYRVKKV